MLLGEADGKGDEGQGSSGEALPRSLPPCPCPTYNQNEEIHR